MGVMAEIFGDEKGLVWSKEVAPFAVHLVRLGNNPETVSFADKLYEDLKKKNIEIVDVILHVGLGTFLPMKTDSEHHVMHAEYFEIPAETLSRLTNALSENRKIIALGTTAYRTLESLWLS